jgi:hypothetical protein
MFFRESDQETQFQFVKRELKKFICVGTLLPQCAILIICANVAWEANANTTEEAEAYGNNLDGS